MGGYRVDHDIQATIAEIWDVTAQELFDTDYESGSDHGRLETHAREDVAELLVMRQIIQ